MIERFFRYVFRKLNIQVSTVAESRTFQALSQTIINLFFRAGTIICSFLMVPVTLHYLDKNNYGVWLTLSSLVGWLAFFDVGMGNGLKNRLAESFTDHARPKAQSYISTTYFLLGAFLLGFLLLYSVIAPFLDWNAILKSTNIEGSELSWIAFISIALFCGRLLCDLINSILAADQRTGTATAITFAGSALTLLAVYIISKTTAPSILYVAIALSAIPAGVSLTANFFLFNGKYKLIRPSLNWINVREGKSLLKLSFSFFIIQLAVLVIYSTDNIVLTQLYGPETVTSYNIVYKYFSVITVVWTILLTPYWTAFSSAYFADDIAWIKIMIRRLGFIWLGLTVAVLAMLLLSKTVYSIWIGNGIAIPFKLSALMSIFVLIGTFGNLYVLLINATGKIKLQLIASVIAALANIPLAIFFAKTLDLGPAGVVIGNCVSLSAGPVLSYIQYIKIINRTDTGIWGK